MKVKDVVILGFLYKASQYLDNPNKQKEMNSFDDRFKNVDPVSLKKELLEKIEEATKEHGKKAEVYFRAGYDAFDEYFNSDTKNTLDEFKRIFFDNEKKEEIKINTNSEDEELLNIISKAALKNSKEEQIDDSPNTKELDSVFTEIVEQEKAPKKVEKKVEKPLSSEDKFFSSLMEHLDNSVLSKRSKKEAENKITSIGKIAEVYPFLSTSFITTVMGLNDGLSNDYVEDESLVILHRSNFQDVESLRQFVEIVSMHDYNVNVDEDKLIVDTFKAFLNKEGKIVTNILEIANQTKVLKGEYEGYKVIRKED